MSGFEKVRQQILNSLDATELDLSNNQMKSLPADIGQLHSLEKLDLSHNQLASLPAEIVQLHSLIELNLKGNPIQNLSALANHPNRNLSAVYFKYEEVLEKIIDSLDTGVLNLSSDDLNLLPVLPAEIWELDSLRQLYLSYNFLTDLPAEIGLLNSLTLLDLSENQLTNLPAEIGLLHSLTWLYLSENQLTNLPVEIGLLNSLTWFDLSGNQLTNLPTEIGQLHSLRELNLSGNQLTNLPTEIGQLHSLRELDLSGNQLTNLPTEIGQLHSLRELNLSGNQLTNLPASIGQLHSLTQLYLRRNPIQDLSALANHPNQNLKVRCFGIDLPRRYWTHLSQWKAEWILAENNAEVRRVWIQQIGYDRIMQELGASAIDQYREYTLLKIDANIDIEPIHLLKMTCPSTAHIHVLRVPPNLTSARDAIRWVNWDIDPEAFAVET